MCFENNKRNLDRLRKGKRAITVWKTGDLDEKTGLVNTGCSDELVVWKKGEVVRPHKILKPLRHGAYCSAGLYFYTTTPPKGESYQRESVIFFPSADSPALVVVARVNPQDIIAVSFDAEMICCIAAGVIRAPGADPKLMRIKLLKKTIRGATGTLDERAKTLKQWEEEREDKEEALQNMRNELKELQPKKSKAQRSKR